MKDRDAVLESAPLPEGDDQDAAGDAALSDEQLAELEHDLRPESEKEPEGDEAA